MVLYIEHLSKAYRRHLILDDVSCEFHAGECVALYGENGTGKTTLFSCLLDLISYRGTIRYDGDNFTSRSWPVAGSIGDCLYPHVSIERNLKFFDCERHDICRQLINTDFLSKKASHLSAGQRKCVNIAIALASDAPVILLDEVSDGLDGDTLELVYGAIAQQCEKGKTIIVTGQNTQVLMHSSTRAIRLEDGHLYEVNPDSSLEGHRA